MTLLRVENEIIPVWPHQENADFTHRDFNFVSFAGCKLKDADFSGSRFNKVILIGAELGNNPGLPAYNSAQPAQVIRTAEELRNALPHFSTDEIRMTYNTLRQAHRDMQDTVDGMQAFVDSKPAKLPQDNPEARQAEIGNAMKILLQEVGQQNQIVRKAQGR